jgi:hypothetical protein
MTIDTLGRLIFQKISSALFFVCDKTPTILIKSRKRQRLHELQIARRKLSIYQFNKKI